MTKSKQTGKRPPKLKQWYMHKRGQMRDKVARLWVYWQSGIWSDTRQLWWVNGLKIINISVKSFMDKGLQSQACAMTYRTILAIVPALALLFAIGRGFGFQTLLQDELFRIIPAQREAISQTLVFVDSYLSQSSEGIFVGIGILFLLWTLISLLSSMEATFNLIWGVKSGRSMWRKITDYTAVLLILPVLMICSSGITLFLSSSLKELLAPAFMSPVISAMFEVLSWIFTWLFFTGVFMMIPATKVHFGNAFAAGVITGTAFMILQWLFVTGQVYVTKYNAIYGSFSFLPLLLIWIQLTWMSVLCGALICYSSQSVFLYQFSAQINEITPRYRRKVAYAVATLTVRRFVAALPPLTGAQITALTQIPPRLLSDVLDELTRAGIINCVLVDEKHEVYGYQPAVDTRLLSVGYVRRSLDNLGRAGFIPSFNERFESMNLLLDKINDDIDHNADNYLLSDIDVDPGPRDVAVQ